MKRKSVTLALVAIVALGAGGALAAVTTDDVAVHSPTTTSQEAELAENHTIEVTDPHETLTSEDVDVAVDAAWENEELRSYFEDGTAVHFEVWAPQPDERRVVVSVAPADAPDESRVLADVHLDRGEVTDVKEPRTLNESTADQITLVDDGEFEVQSGTQSERLVENRTVESTDDESITFDVGTEDEVVALDEAPQNRTIVSGDERWTVASDE